MPNLKRTMRLNESITVDRTEIKLVRVAGNRVDLLFVGPVGQVRPTLPATRADRPQERHHCWTCLDSGTLLLPGDKLMPCPDCAPATGGPQ
jgi:hypothetical protein